MGSHALVVVLIVLAVLFVFGGYGYAGPGGAYPYRSYAFPGLGVIVVLIIALYFLGVVR